MIAFLVDGNSHIGMGHMMRCMCIADALVNMGKDILFILSPDSDVQSIKRGTFNVIKMPKSGNQGWDLQEALKTIRLNNVSLLVIDSYRIMLNDFTEFKKNTKVIYLDDLYTYNADVNAIINCNIDSRSEPYNAACVSGRKVFTGAGYFPLRQEFAGYKNASLRQAVKSVLITTGSTDPCKCAAQIIKTVPINDYPGILFKILLGKYYPDDYVDYLKMNCIDLGNIKFVEWGRNIAKTISESDVVISSGSSTVFESLSLNVPCITFQFAENHNAECVELDRLGMAPWAGIYGSVHDVETNDCLRNLFMKELEYEVRLEQCKVYTPVFDGGGLQRIIKIICEMEVSPEF